MKPSKALAGVSDGDVEAGKKMNKGGIQPPTARIFS